jgi:hypothetical protein
MAWNSPTIIGLAVVTRYANRYPIQRSNPRRCFIARDFASQQII